MRRAGRRRAAVAVVAALGVAASAPAEEAPSDGDCFDRPIVTVYLHRLQDRILDQWGLPPDGLTDQRVVVSLRLDAQGTLRSFELSSWSSRDVAVSVSYALLHAEPFGALPAGAECLAERKIQATFENPGE